MSTDRFGSPDQRRELQHRADQHQVTAVRLGYDGVRGRPVRPADASTARSVFPVSGTASLLSARQSLTGSSGVFPAEVDGATPVSNLRD